MLISPFINFWKACLIIALCKIAAVTPHTVGFLIHPSKLSFFQCAPQLAFKGKFVNPLRNAALVGQYFKTTPGTKGLTSFHSTSIRVNRLASLNDLRSFSFHSVCSPFEPSPQISIFVHKARASFLGTCPARNKDRSQAHPPNNICSRKYILPFPLI